MQAKTEPSLACTNPYDDEDEEGTAHGNDRSIPRHL